MTVLQLIAALRRAVSRDEISGDARVFFLDSNCQVDIEKIRLEDDGAVELCEALEE